MNTLEAAGILGGTRLDDIRARAASGQPLKSFEYYSTNNMLDAYRPFIEEAQEDRIALLEALDQARSIDVERLARAIHVQRDSDEDLCFTGGTRANPPRPWHSCEEDAKDIAAAYAEAAQ